MVADPLQAQNSIFSKTSKKKKDVILSPVSPKMFKKLKALQNIIFVNDEKKLP